MTGRDGSKTSKKGDFYTGGEEGGLVHKGGREGGLVHRGGREGGAFASVDIILMVYLTVEWFRLLA